MNNEIVPFANGTDALALPARRRTARARSAPAAQLLILLDLNLPDMTGIDILAKVKANPHCKRSPVVVLTTTDDQREIQRCYDLGANVYITKPVNYESFANAIRQLGLFFSVMQVPETDSSHAPIPIRVLYIDDDAGLGRLVQQAPGAAGIAAGAMPAGRRGHARCCGRARIDAMALDHDLAGETGLDVLATIREPAGAPPVIYVTGSEDARVAVAALKAGAVDYVWKDVAGPLSRTARRRPSTRRWRGRGCGARRSRPEREMREARDRAEVLLREVNHRVANSLALVAALARLQAKAVRDESRAPSACSEMQARIAAIAGVHRRLYTSPDVRSVDMAIYLDEPGARNSERRSRARPTRTGSLLEVDSELQARHRTRPSLSASW